MALSTMIQSNNMMIPIDHSRRFSIRAHQEAVYLDRRPQSAKPPNHAISRLTESLSHLLHLQIETPPKPLVQGFSARRSERSTPTKSPKESIAERWREIHGSNGWAGLLDPLHPWLRREILKYGEFAQATYDAFDFDPFSEYCGSCRYGCRRLVDKMGLSDNGYTVSKYLYAMSHIDMPQWLKRSHLVEETSWSRDSNWMGYVAVSDDNETRRLGRRNIVVAWRGTVAPSEWYEDFQRKLKPLGHGKSEAMVEDGFLSLYTSKSDATRYNKTSASEQAMEELARLVEMYRGKGEEVSLTVTGHSLGGALALLCAHEAARSHRGLPVSVVSFGAPRVGNIAFRDELHGLGVRTLRVVVKQDVVPKMPGLVINEGLERFDEITGPLEWVYAHVGAELRLDVRSSPYLKQGGLNLPGFHSLETYLHLVDGLESQATSFRSGARRDVALVNKACDMVVDELRIPHCWYQLANKGLVCDDHGRWVKPKRELEDIPSPIVRELEQQQQQQQREQARHALADLKSDHSDVFQPVFGA